MERIIFSNIKPQDEKFVGKDNISKRILRCILMQMKFEREKLFTSAQKLNVSWI
jgi:hypothetical protein